MVTKIMYDRVVKNHGGRCATERDYTTLNVFFRLLAGRGFRNERDRE